MTTLAPASADLLRPTVRVRSAPPLEPPYDDGSAARSLDRHGPHGGNTRVAPAKWQALPLPFEDLGQPTFERTERPRPPGWPSHGGVDSGIGSAVTTSRPADPGDPRCFAARLARLTAEVMAGDRAVSQIAPLLSPTVRAVLKRRLRFAKPTPDPRQRWRPNCVPIRAPVVVLGRPRPGVVEAGVVLHREERTRAYAMRLELRHNRWCCTALEIV